MTAIIDGREVASLLHMQLRERLKHLSYRPCLVAILVGDDPASSIYVRRKSAAASKLGITAGTIHLPKDVAEQELICFIGNLNRDSNVHGILVQLPLPSQIDTAKVLESIDPVKDIDGFHPINVGRLGNGGTYHMPCTPKGIMRILRHAEVALPSRRVLVIGCSQIVGQPVATLLTKAGATVTVAHKLTHNLAAECLWAEIIITAAGCPNLVRGSYIRRDAVIIDVGINRLNGKIVGDVAFDECLGIAKAITPVPGGVGPVTIACLLENTIEAAKLQHRVTYCET